MIVAGTRPELIKLAPIILELKRRNADFIFVWSGQHYDYNMSKIFLKEFRLPEPDENLEVGSGSHSAQTSRIMLRLERVIKRYEPSIIVAEGDTNTVLAAALTSVKSLVPFAHVEAGLRSWNMAMPEEVNRRAVDSISQLLFAPTPYAKLNLLAEGIPESSIHLSGNTVLDSVILMLKYTESKSILRKHGLERDRYILATIHRQENTENPRRLRSIFTALKRLTKLLDVIIPLHPRTALKLKNLNIDTKGVKVIEPVGYVEFLSLLRNCSLVITDSGGVQEEAFILGIPTLTVRRSTEWVETVVNGYNELTGYETRKIFEAASSKIKSKHQQIIPEPEAMRIYGGGKASKSIVEKMIAYLESGGKIKEPNLVSTPVCLYILCPPSVPGMKFQKLLSFNTNGVAEPLDGKRRYVVTRTWVRDKICDEKR